MNIFCLSLDVTECAEYHNSKHTIKMILEYCQLLSTAHRVLDGKEVIEKRYVADSVPARYRNVKVWSISDKRDSLLYSATHVSHPSAVWVRQSSGNYNWLANLLVKLCEEYTYRYGKVHKAQRDGLVKMLHETVPNNIPLLPFTQPTCAMPDECVISGDSISSYRNYYNLNKTHLADWSGKVNSRSVPSWYTPNVPYVNSSAR